MSSLGAPDLILGTCEVPYEILLQIEGVPYEGKSRIEIVLPQGGVKIPWRIPHFCDIDEGVPRAVARMKTYPRQKFRTDIYIYRNFRCISRTGV